MKVARRGIRWISAEKRPSRRGIEIARLDHRFERRGKRLIVRENRL
jgi:hypothetical protein